MSLSERNRNKKPTLPWDSVTLQWRHNERDGVSNHRRLLCLLCRLFRQIKENIKAPRVCEGNPPMTGGFPSQRASNTENVFIWLRHHDQPRATSTKKVAEVSRIQCPLADRRTYNKVNNRKPNGTATTGPDEVTRRQSEAAEVTRSQCPLFLSALTQTYRVRRESGIRLGYSSGATQVGKKYRDCKNILD